MKRLHLALLLSPLVFMSAFADARELDAMDWPLGCPHVSATLVAKDGYPGGQTMISIQPDTVHVKEGCDFIILNPGNHRISTDGGSATWLNGGPTTTDLQLGPAPSGLGIFKYEIKVDGIGLLDPRARVL